ncbi:peptidoglycan-binding protein [Paracoccus sp. MC1862]|nr:peptidoglycan-binding protein [Paracoccus sp. MC1854]MBB1499333.1 peptidoglycan-binding protein [Paracoccus sp. MC1862]
MEQQQLSWAGPLAGTAEAGPADVETVAQPELAPPHGAAGASTIRWLQAALNRVGNAGLAENGVAGRATCEAVRGFQAAQGLAADGVAGPRTMAALRAALEDGGGAAALAGDRAACAGLPQRQVLDRFAFGQPGVPPIHQPRIDAIAACLLASLDSPTPMDGLSLIGHTDPVGSEADNLALGQRRAEAVAAAIEASLRRRAGGRPFSFVFTPSSRGETEPLADPASSRRVEVVAPFAFPKIGPRPEPTPPVPPVPPFRSDLDPPRWGPILSRVIGPRATIRSGNAVRHLVDAENPGAPALAGYPAMVDAIRGASGGEAFIYLLGWICVDDFPMITCDASSKLRVLLADAAARGVQVRAVFWEAPIIYLTQRRQTQASADRINALPGGGAIIDGETLRSGAHHQKLLVVGDGRGLVGFTGGLDVNPDRILPSTITCPPVPVGRGTILAREDETEVWDGAIPEAGGAVWPDDWPGNPPNVESMSGGGGSPLHDVHCRVEGPAAFDLLGTFITRWDHHPGSRRIEARAPLRGRRAAVPAPLTRPLPPGISSTGETCSAWSGARSTRAAARACRASGTSARCCWPGSPTRAASSTWRTSTC